MIPGENGAGRSTLMKVLGGEYLPDPGSVESEIEEAEASELGAEGIDPVDLVGDEPSVFAGLDVDRRVVEEGDPLWGDIQVPDDVVEDLSIRFDVPSSSEK